MPARHGPAGRRDDGLTLVELVVAMAVFGLLATVATRAEIAVVRDTARTMRSGQEVGDVRLSVDTLDRQVRSAVALFSDASAAGCTALGAGTTCLRVSTIFQNQPRCEQWQVLADASAPGTAYLRTRRYSPTWATDGQVDGWQTLARGLTAPTGSTPPFVVTTPAGGGPTLAVAITAPDPASPGGLATISTSLTPRPLLYASASSTCSGAAP
jgi:prepilin-type N-terminal cleavage/methylation domain-containing protein